MALFGRIGGAFYGFWSKFKSILPSISIFGRKKEKKADHTNGQDSSNVSSENNEDANRDKAPVLTKKNDQTSELNKHEIKLDQEPSKEITNEISGKALEPNDQNKNNQEDVNKETILPEKNDQTLQISRSNENKKDVQNNLDAVVGENNKNTNSQESLNKTPALPDQTLQTSGPDQLDQGLNKNQQLSRTLRKNRSPLKIGQDQSIVAKEGTILNEIIEDRKSAKGHITMRESPVYDQNKYIKIEYYESNFLSGEKMISDLLNAQNNPTPPFLIERIYANDKGRTAQADLKIQRKILKEKRFQILQGSDSFTLLCKFNLNTTGEQYYSYEFKDEEALRTAIEEINKSVSAQGNGFIQKLALNVNDVLYEFARYKSLDQNTTGKYYLGQFSDNKTLSNSTNKQEQINGLTEASPLKNYSDILKQIENTSDNAYLADGYILKAYETYKKMIEEPTSNQQNAFKFAFGLYAEEIFFKIPIEKTLDQTLNDFVENIKNHESQSSKYESLILNEWRELMEECLWDIFKNNLENYINAEIKQREENPKKSKVPLSESLFATMNHLGFMKAMSKYNRENNDPFKEIDDKILELFKGKVLEKMRKCTNTNNAQNKEIFDKYYKFFYNFNDSEDKEFYDNTYNSIIAQLQVRPRSKSQPQLISLKVSTNR